MNLTWPGNEQQILGRCRNDSVDNRYAFAARLIVINQDLSALFGKQLWKGLRGFLNSLVRPVTLSLCISLIRGKCAHEKPIARASLLTESPAGQLSNFHKRHHFRHELSHCGSCGQKKSVEFSLAESKANKCATKAEFFPIIFK